VAAAPDNYATDKNRTSSPASQSKATNGNVNLPDGSGLDVADAAKARGVEALVVTGYGLTIQAGILSAYDYLLKPLRGHELIAGIERHLTH